MPLPDDFPHCPQTRVIRQLVEALLFERCVEAEQCEDEANGICRYVWVMQDRTYRCHAKTGAFDRVRMIPGSLEVSAGDGNWYPAGLLTLIADLPAMPGIRRKLHEELNQTIRLCHWNHTHLERAANRRELDLAEMESALDEGHPYHPSFKSRTGFTEEDHRNFGPEAGTPFQLKWVAIPRERLHQALPVDDEKFWRSELYGQDGSRKEWELLMTRLHGQGGSLKTHGLLPLHPWQWTKFRNGELAARFDPVSTYFLGSAGDRYVASQSVRTLFNVDNPAKANIKLSMNMVNTSSKRVIEPVSVCPAPSVSRWLKDVVDSDPLFSTRYPVTLLGEYAGGIADSNGELAYLFRESAMQYIGAGESVVPFNALMMVENDGRAFIDDWVSQYGLEEWVNRLIDVAVLPVWHLLVSHGLAVEAHGQNMVLVHRDGWPERIILRDFHESLEYVPSFLKETDRVPDLSHMPWDCNGENAAQYYQQPNLELLRELVMDTLFVFNLSEVSHLLDHCYCMPEPHFWQKVATRLHAYAKEHRLETRQAMLCFDDLKIYTESLMTRKFSGSHVEYHHLVTNPLFSKISQECDAYDVSE
ncbi:short-chain isoprenyl diphosphate synthase [Parasalinivibrio latis]|uniref:IucA/IucC family protein n=1 Tax=Parasalinivibrio latis TaxID=2952610 RepID=UPI0030E5C666